MRVKSTVRLQSLLDKNWGQRQNRCYQHGRVELFIGCKQMLDPFPIALEWFFAVRSKSWRRPAMRVRNKMQGMRAATEWVRPLFIRLYEKAFAVLAIPDQ